MPLNPKVEAYLEQLNRNPSPPIWEQTIDDARQAMLANDLGIGPELPVESVIDLPVGVNDIRVMARLYRPYGEESRLNCAAVYFHGGGWVVGDIASHDRYCRALAVRSQSAVLSVDYRLAPEHPYPAALQDACSAYQWLSRNGHRYGIDVGKISLIGDSAGGNLAAATALAAKRNQWLQPAAQVLIYPIVDSDLETESYSQFAEGYGLTRRAMQWFWDQYAPDVETRKDPYLSPLREDELAALPPALILTAEFDPLRDEAEKYAAKLERAKVRVKLIRYEGQIHGFARRLELFDQAEQALSQVAETVRTAAVEVGDPSDFMSDNRGGVRA